MSGVDGWSQSMFTEKVRRWEAQDFPTNTIQLLSAVRMEDRTRGISFGSIDALYQIYMQDDSLAAMACGLGGGSLVNAGVMVPAPVRARRNPKWPKDWELYEASASEMFMIQRVPIQFKNAKIMEEVAEEELGLIGQTPVKLCVNFDTEDQLSESKESQETDSCKACGNCLSGCLYNAKNSSDKTYLVSAIQAGCVIKTECEVQYVVRNPFDACEIEEIEISRRKRRWRLVFLNEFDYILSDFVVLSAGVFGTTKILFQSQMRGLIISQKLGTGLSCNGNNVAYLAQSRAPLNAYGLEKEIVGCSFPTTSRAIHYIIVHFIIGLHDSECSNSHFFSYAAFQRNYNLWMAHRLLFLTWNSIQVEASSGSGQPRYGSERHGI